MAGFYMALLFRLQLAGILFEQNFGLERYFWSEFCQLKFRLERPFYNTSVDFKKEDDRWSITTPAKLESSGE